jgi:hypothetical protein
MFWICTNFDQIMKDVELNRQTYNVVDLPKNSGDCDVSFTFTTLRVIVTECVQPRNGLVVFSSALCIFFIVHGKHCMLLEYLIQKLSGLIDGSKRCAAKTIALFV